MKHRGSCHCGTVTFEVEAPSAIEAVRCNCSMCSMTGFVHLIVPKEDFRLITGAEKITTYTFNTHTAKHTFCSICGVKSFYTPRSHPDGISVNVNCIDPETIENITFDDFDGANWEQNIDDLRTKDE
ncbi:GFA family protein [Emcibacter sp.]|uniref:GFA family protein n=1 Tax=Emcibacter sp. TaxID=1979954 RepID=UPI002AA884C0|nr:GFA family protein [Emcibacter sp.]